MCDTCGCGDSDELKIHKPGEENFDTHNHGHGPHDHGSHDHPHTHQHDHSTKKVINLNMDILSENNRLAERNRGYFEGKRILCLNLVSSPGSGKTTILEKTITSLLPSRKIYVIEGDQQTARDAERIEKSGAPAIQINTGSGCHLDARMVHLALKKLEVENEAILFIENVGNLVCPALFDLGEEKRVVVISVTEGDTYATLAAVDPLLDVAGLQENVKVYLPPGHDPRDPLVSPVYCGTSYTCDWPPTLITVGTRDVFLSCAFRLYRTMKAGGAPVELSGWEGMWHNFWFWLDMPEGMAATREMADFLGNHLK
jgi:hydrogenase nickel incorporation protein HypB